MSRSYRRTPICGISKAESDKWYKTSEHRRERRSVKAAILQDIDADYPDPKRFGSPWKSAKDGKQWLGNKYPELMRK